MKFYRFMDVNEFNILVNGGYVADRRTWEHCHTSSKGVCFLPCEDVKEALHSDDFLTGIVGDFALVEFINVGKKPTFSRGFYSCGWVDECYLPGGYDSTDMRPVRVAYPDKWGCFYDSTFVRFKGKIARKEWDMP